MGCGVKAGKRGPSCRWEGDAGPGATAKGMDAEELSWIGCLMSGWDRRRELFQVVGLLQQKRRHKLKLLRTMYSRVAASIYVNVSGVINCFRIGMVLKGTSLMTMKEDGGHL